MRWRLIGCFAAIILSSAPVHADVATEWNKRTIELGAELKWPTARTNRAVAMVAIAQFDALVAIRPGPKAYVFTATPATEALEPAAASQAAAVVLTALAPEKTAMIETANAATLAALPPGAAREAGVDLGARAAAAILAARKDDGENYSVERALPEPAPGIYQRTGPGPLVTPFCYEMKPFTLASFSSVALPPPPPLDSSQHQRDLAELRARGGAKAGTPEEAGIAAFHAPSGFPAWNEIARASIEKRQLDLRTSAQVLAVMNSALSDAFSAGMENKYRYLLWRPVTEIRANGAADADWTPKIVLPLHPEYPCMHCVVGFAATRVLATILPEATPFDATSAGVTRHFRSFRDYAEEEAESRVLAGVHYRWSLVAGQALGETVGKAALARFDVRR